MSINIYIHKTCPTSTKLLELLEKNNLLDKVNVIDVGEEPFKLLNKGAISVPYIEKDGELVDMGPIDFEKVLSAIKTHLVDKPREKVFNDIATKLMHLVVDNVFYSISVYLRESLTFLLDSEPVVKYLCLEDKVESFKEWLVEKEIEILTNYIESIKKTIVRNFLFEIKLLKGEKITLDKFKKSYSVQHIAHWLLFRGSVARVSLINIEKINVIDKAQEIYNEILLKLGG